VGYILARRAHKLLSHRDTIAVRGGKKRSAAECRPHDMRRPLWMSFAVRRACRVAPVLHLSHLISLLTLVINMIYTAIGQVNNMLCFFNELCRSVRTNRERSYKHAPLIYTFWKPKHGFCFVAALEKSLTFLPVHMCACRLVYSRQGRIFPANYIFLRASVQYLYGPERYGQTDGQHCSRIRYQI